MLLSMDKVETHSTFELIWAFSAKMDRCVQRCEEIAKGEAALGYEESALTYWELSRELRVAKAWWHELLQATIQVF